MYASEILPNLWIGDKRSPAAAAFKKKYDIALVVNCTRTIPFYRGTHKNIRIPVDDDLTDSSRLQLFNYLSSIVEVIGEYIKKRRGVLVHCHAGCQRSATVVIHRVGAPVSAQQIQVPIAVNVSQRYAIRPACRTR